MNRKSAQIRDFELQGLIGSGHYGKVYKVRFTRNNKIYAMKVLNKSKLGTET